MDYFRGVFSAPNISSRPSFAAINPTVSDVSIDLAHPSNSVGPAPLPGPESLQNPRLGQPNAYGPMISQLSADQFARLEDAFSEAEIWEAISECGSSKAPGPDDFNIGFYKKFWSTIKEDLISAIHDFWEKGEISRGCNASFITVVPKKVDPISLNEYRPISLIGSFYKVVAKILSNRLRKVIPNLVGFEQSAFIKGRNIMDGALIANETLEYLKNHKLKSLIFKVDFEKAFDSLSWEFLVEIMTIMWFGGKWRKWIISCLSSASISVLVNGSPTNEFKLERGVRQGDPLSHFLFILAAEGLNVLTKMAVQNNVFKGVEVGQNKVPISHLQYADDMIFFGQWNENNLCNLMKLLKCFELSSGLKVNYHKSILYGVCVEKSVTEYMARKLRCNVGQHIDSLGVLFSDSFIRSIGDGSSTYFWKDSWLGSALLKDIFCRLARLDRNPDATVRERLLWDGSVAVPNWDWSRPPSGRVHSELQQLANLIAGVKMDPSVSDAWEWCGNNGSNFTTKGLTSLINSKTLSAGANAKVFLRNNMVPKKVEIFIWRARRERIPVRIELDKREIDLHSVRCPICDDDVESVGHALLGCKKVFDIWLRVFKWWGLSNVSIPNLDSLLCGLSNVVNSESGKSIWQGVVWSTCYLIWKNRNSTIFKNKCWNSPNALIEIQMKSFE
ncbi:uncharacterized protein [Rutidosis leptorrhynchoides]|uniref:uncharacterized protein n=1 Tax=Rutidosis leptorrhynchoides TaxID=125765 RepID=UPI003A9A100D